MRKTAFFLHFRGISCLPEHVWPIFWCFMIIVTSTKIPMHFANSCVAPAPAHADFFSCNAFFEFAINLTGVSDDRINGHLA